MASEANELLDNNRRASEEGSVDSTEKERLAREIKHEQKKQLKAEKQQQKEAAKLGMWKRFKNRFYSLFFCCRRKKLEQLKNQPNAEVVEAVTIDNKSLNQARFESVPELQYRRSG